MANTGRRYSRQQMTTILKEAGADSVRVGDVLRRHGVAPKTYYRWKARLGAVVVSDVPRIRDLEAENIRLKRIVADQSLNIEILKEMLGRV